MKLHAVILSAFVALLCCASPVRADDATKLAKAEELLQLTQSGQMMKMLEPMMNAMVGAAKPDMSEQERARIAAVHQKVAALFAERFDQVKPALAKAYTDTYTEEELTGILTFYKSPIGKALLQKMPDVMQRSAPVMMNMLSGLQGEIQKIAQESKP